ncbi:hypothetical protein V9J15_04020 [Candidatus Liberibacter africanus]
MRDSDRSTHEKFTESLEQIFMSIHSGQDFKKLFIDKMSSNDPKDENCINNIIATINNHITETFQSSWEKVTGDNNKKVNFTIKQVNKYKKIKINATEDGK